MTAGLLSVGIGAPVDLVKIRLQMQTQSIVTENFNLAGNVSLRTVSLHEPSYYRGPVHCISTIVQNEGISGLYRGAGAMVLRDIPGYTAYFVPYTFLCGWLTPEGDVAPNCITIWLAGGLAVIQYIRHNVPPDIKSEPDMAVQYVTNRMKEAGAISGHGNYSVFFRGAAVNTIRGFPMSATMFLSYELSLKLFRGL
ncbi:S2548 protein, partial [Polypterus senegalus]